jgi:hypothetical protein
MTWDQQRKFCRPCYAGIVLLGILKLPMPETFVTGSDYSADNNLHAGLIIRLMACGNQGSRNRLFRLPDIRKRRGRVFTSHILTFNFPSVGELVEERLQTPIETPVQLVGGVLVYCDVDIYPTTFPEDYIILYTLSLCPSI